jgi:alpha-tubulin suppressor-like RCC1 family protein
MILADGINTLVAVHDNGILRECDLMRCGRRSIKSKNKDKKREGDTDKERERERERAVATCLESVTVIMEFKECD